MAGFARRFKLSLRPSAASLIFAGLLALASPAAAKDCADLTSAVLAHGKVTSAALVPAGGFQMPASPFGPPPGVLSAAFKNIPAFCRVQATLTPTSDSDIEVWLPAAGWNGKFVGIGNGVWAGSISYFEMGGPLSRGYAVGATDAGHTGNGLSADFAVGHPEKLTDFGYRAVHEMTLAAKEVIRNFYGDAPKISLWNSCSTGGRQGLMEAYRCPEDYDAILAMAPANPMTGLMTQSLWTGYQALRAPGAALSQEKLSALHKAYVAQCDAKDGLVDGLVSAPRSCRFDPAIAQCKAGDRPDCLTAEQVETMRAIYGGVRDPKTGEQIFPVLWRKRQKASGRVLDESTTVATALCAPTPTCNLSRHNVGRELLRAIPYLICNYVVSAKGQPFSAREQVNAFTRIRGKTVAHRKSRPSPDDYDTFLFRPQCRTVQGRTVLTWSIGQNIHGRTEASYNADADAVTFDWIATNSGIRFETFVAIPELGKVAISDRAGEHHMGARQAASRFETVIGALIEDGEAEVELAATYADVDRALRTFDLTEFSFSVRPTNPHPSRLTERLDREMKIDGIGQLAGKAKAKPGGVMRMKQDGYIEQAVDLAQAGYGQVSVKAVTPQGKDIHFGKPTFSLERRKNERAQQKPQTLRIFLDEELNDDDQNREAAKALIELYD